MFLPVLVPVVAGSEVPTGDADEVWVEVTLPAVDDVPVVAVVEVAILL